MSARKAKRVPKKPAPPMLPERELRKLEVVEIRLHRATDVLTAIDYCANNSGSGEVNLGALAIAARDLIDKVLDDLAPLRPWPAKDCKP